MNILYILYSHTREAYLSLVQEIQDIIPGMPIVAVVVYCTVNWELLVVEIFS